MSAGKKYKSEKERAWLLRQAMKVLERQQAALREVAIAKREIGSEALLAIKENDVRGFQLLLEQLKDLVLEERVLKQLLPKQLSLPLRSSGEQTVVFSSWMMRDSFAICTETQAEGLHFVTGIDLDGLAIGTRIVTFPYAARSVAGATGDHQATQGICIETHEMGHRLIAMIHSHPGSGIHANHRSGTDERSQQRWEKTTRMIGGIWSRDGYLRFYSSKLPFTVRIIGNMIEEVEPNVYKLAVPETLPLSLPGDDRACI